MTQVFQVGDIVYINELTPEIKRERDRWYWHVYSDIEPLVGQHAVIVSVEQTDSGRVTVNPCAPDYRYQFGDELDWDTMDTATTVPSQLTLVAKSPYRTCVISTADEADEFSHFKGRLPLVGETMNWVVDPSKDVHEVIQIPIHEICLSTDEVELISQNRRTHVNKVLSVPTDAFETTSVFTTF